MTMLVYVLMIALDLSYHALAEPQVRTECFPFNVLELLQEKINLERASSDIF